MSWFGEKKTCCFCPPAPNSPRATESALSSKRSPTPIGSGRHSRPDLLQRTVRKCSGSNRHFVGARPQVDRLFFQVMLGGQIAHRAAFSAHQDGVRDGRASVDLDALEKRAITDAGGHEKDLVASRQVLGAIDGV